VGALWDPHLYEVEILPVGLVVDQLTGLVTGTPTDVGESRCRITTTNLVGKSEAWVTFAIAEQEMPVITSSYDPWVFELGVAASYQITATNNPTSFSADNLPAGMSVNTITGLISGTPTTAATSNATIGAHNYGGSAIVPIAFTVSAPTALSVMTNDDTVEGTVGVAFDLELTATNDPTDWSTDDLLNWGVALNGYSGYEHLSGTPTVAGEHVVHLDITNAEGVGHGTVTITVSEAPET
jgi:hypothetical protein